MHPQLGARRKGYVIKISNSEPTLALDVAGIMLREGGYECMLLKILDENLTDVREFLKTKNCNYASHIL